MKKYLLLIPVGLAIFIAYGYYQYKKNVFGNEVAFGDSGAIPDFAPSAVDTAAGKSDWPRWRGPAGDGKSAVGAIRTDWSGGLQMLWGVDYLCQGESSSTWSAPVVRGSALVVPGRAEGEDIVFCLDADSGRPYWAGRYKADADDKYGPGARATPFIDAERVYTFGRSGDLVCWMLADGQLLWRKNVVELGGTVPRWGHSSSPLVIDDKVIVQCGGESIAMAFDKMSGDIAWKSEPGEASYAAVTSMQAAGVSQAVVFHAAGVSGFAVDDGRTIWSLPWETDWDVNATTPLVDDESVFITSGYRTGCELIDVGEDGAQVRWRSEVIASQHSDPLLIDGFLYGYSGQSRQNRGDFKCVDFATGEQKWSTTEVGWGTALYADGHIVCFDIEGNLYLVEPSPDEFVKLTEFRGAMPGVTEPSWTVPVIAGGNIYLRYRQNLLCYRLSGK